MEAIICIPGIEGSVLALNGTQVWPPTLPEVIFGYRRLNELMDAHVISTAIVESVAVFPIYKPLLGDLGEIARRQNARFLAFHYDWRKDLAKDPVTELARA